MKKTLLIITGILLIVFVGLSLVYYFGFVLPEKKIAKECQGFIPGWLDFIECSGVIAINDGWDMDYISIKDHVHDYEVARVYNQNQYVFANKKLFVINRKYIENEASDGKETTYYQKLFQNGKLIENSYNSTSTIPNYLIVETQTGEARSYKNIGEVPQSEQDYFKDIQDK